MPGKENNVVSRANRFVGNVAAWLVLPLILIGAYNSVVRTLGRHVEWISASNALIELQWHLFSTIFLLGGAYTLMQHGHVRVDILFERLAPKAQAWINILGCSLLLLPFCAVMIWVSVPWVIDAFQRGEVSSDAQGLPVTHLKAMVPIAFLLLGAQTIVWALEEIRSLRNAEDTDGN